MGLKYSAVGSGADPGVVFGNFDTAMMSAAPDAVRDSLSAQSIFPARFGRPGEFAQLVEQIVENPMLNGTVLRLDGAMRMQAK